MKPKDATRYGDDADADADAEGAFSAQSLMQLALALAVATVALTVVFSAVAAVVFALTPKPGVDFLTETSRTVAALFLGFSAMAAFGAAPSLFLIWRYQLWPLRFFALAGIVIGVGFATFGWLLERPLPNSRVVWAMAFGVAMMVLTRWIAGVRADPPL